MAFEKGKSGNPGGRPKENAEVKALAREYGPAAIEKLAALMNCGNPRTEVAAAQALLDRGYGKSTEYRESVIHKTIEHRAVSETDSRISELLGHGQDRDTAETLPH